MSRNGIEFGGGGGRITWVGQAPTRHAAKPEEKAAILNGFREPAIQGKACVFEKAHHGKDGGIEIFMPGCFAEALTGKKTVRLLTAHEGIGLIATTADRLELLEDDDCLGFRCRLDSEMAYNLTAAQLVRNGSLPEVSVGYRSKREEMRTLGGQQVRVFWEVDLVEISLVKHGAVPGTRSMLVNVKGRRPLRDEMESGELLKQSSFKLDDEPYDRVLERLKVISDRMVLIKRGL